MRQPMSTLDVRVDVQVDTEELVDQLSDEEAENLFFTLADRVINAGSYFRGIQQNKSTEEAMSDYIISNGNFDPNDAITAIQNHDMFVSQEMIERMKALIGEQDIVKKTLLGKLKELEYVGKDLVNLVEEL